MATYETADDEIIVPDADQIAMLAGGKGRVCGQCKHFAHKEGQRSIAQSRFLEAVVKDYGWKLHHLGAPPQDLALCAEYSGGDLTRGGQMITTRYADFAPRRGTSLSPDGFTRSDPRPRESDLGRGLRRDVRRRGEQAQDRQTTEEHPRDRTRSRGDSLVLPHRRRPRRRRSSSARARPRA